MPNCSNDMKTIKVKSDSKAVNGLCEQLLADLKENGFSEDDIFATHLALEEALVNAVKHGNNSDSSKKVTVKYRITDKKFDIYIIDEGNGFKPCDVPDPRCNGNLFKPGGRGVLLMRAYMDKVEFNESGNTVHMVRAKNRKDAD